VPQPPQNDSKQWLGSIPSPGLERSAWVRAKRHALCYRSSVVVLVEEVAMSSLLEVEKIEPPPRLAEAGKREPKKMSMALINLILDAALFFTIIAVMWISVMLQVIFPPPTVADGWRLWGLGYDQWRNAQFYALCLFALLSVEHVVLHWNWVCCTIATQLLRLKTRPDEASQAVLGVGTFITILVTMMATLVAALLSVASPTP
jgi:hypothetical protein